MFRVWDAQDDMIASHLRGLDSPLRTACRVLVSEPYTIDVTSIVWGMMEFWLEHLILNRDNWDSNIRVVVLKLRQFRSLHVANSLRAVIAV